MSLPSRFSLLDDFSNKLPSYFCSNSLPSPPAKANNSPTNVSSLFCLVFKITHLVYHLLKATIRDDISYSFTDDAAAKPDHGLEGNKTKGLMPSFLSNRTLFYRLFMEQRPRLFGSTFLGNTSLLYLCFRQFPSKCPGTVSSGFLTSAYRLLLLVSLGVGESVWAEGSLFWRLGAEGATSKKPHWRSSCLLIGLGQHSPPPGDYRDAFQ